MTTPPSNVRVVPPQSRKAAIKEHLNRTPFFSLGTLPSRRFELIPGADCFFFPSYNFRLYLPPKEESGRYSLGSLNARGERLLRRVCVSQNGGFFFKEWLV